MLDMHLVLGPDRRDAPLPFPELAYTVPPWDLCHLSLEDRGVPVPTWFDLRYPYGVPHISPLGPSRRV